MAPEQKPRTLDFRHWMNSAMAHAAEPTAEERVVVTKALAAIESAPRALPALKPYQPTQSIDVPTMQSTMECGGIFSRPKPLRRPSIRQMTSDDHPLVVWTTRPPAKSMALMSALGLLPEAIHRAIETPDAM